MSRPTLVPMASPDIGPAEIEAVNRVIRSPVLSIGPELDAFEQAVAEAAQAQHAVGVSSGTAGLHLGVIAAGVGAGDMVLTTPFSFVASSNCVLYERGLPIFVDVDRASGNIDPALVQQAARDLMEGGAAARRWLPRALREDSSQRAAIGSLKALLPVHAFGRPAAMDELLTIARDYQLCLIEDACEALGGEYRGKRVGALGGVGVFAFYPNKQITTGEGGMIVTNDETWAALFRSLRNQGRDVFDAWLAHSRLGYNYRLDELSAALGRAQMQRLDALLDQRERVAGWYGERLAGLELVETPTMGPETTRASWFVYVVRIKSPAQRDEVMRKLADKGVPSRPYFTPIHLQPFYRQTFGYARGDFPVAEWLGDVSLALPFSGVMTESQVDLVCEQLRDVLR